MDKQKSLKDAYEKKYFDKTPHVKNSRVAPQTPGTKVVKIFGFEKKWDIYPEFENKNVTDIWGGLSNFAFELSPSVQKIIVVDPTYQYNLQECVEEQYQKATKRIQSTIEVQSTSKKDLTENLKLEKEVAEWIQKRRQNFINPDPKIELNSSFAQDLKWISENSQDFVFFNFVLHTLKDEISLEDEIVAAVNNAYRITKVWGKIYGIHDAVSKEDEIINALSKTDYTRDARHKEHKKYTVFIIDKK